MRVYVDSSVVVARILREPGVAGYWSRWQTIVSSELLKVEAFRVMDRLRLRGRLSDSEVAAMAALILGMVARMERIPIGPAVLGRASAPFPTMVHTLNAIHLASALAWMEDHGEPLVFATRDEQLALAARACGLEVIGVAPT
jgi:predicted nucleic acid-binding protein